MPDQWERHGRSGEDDWGGSPARSQARAQAADDDPVHSSTPSHHHPGECKSPEGWGLHQLHLTTSYYRKIRSCGWAVLWVQGDYGPSWRCYHQIECRNCGKKFGPAKRCPDYKGDARKVPQDILELIEQYRARRRRWDVTSVRAAGPTHYRKPKGK